MERAKDANDPNDYYTGKSVYILHGYHFGGSLQTAQVIEDHPIDNQSFHAIKFVPKIATMTNSYKKGRILTKGKKWIDPVDHNELDEIVK